MRNERRKKQLRAALAWIAGCAICAAPAAGRAENKQLPNAPGINLLAQVGQTTTPPGPAVPPPVQMPIGQAPPMPPPPPTFKQTGPRLTIAEAEKMAIANNPHISVAHLLALAQAQMTREARSAFLPTVSSDLTAVDAYDESRITGAGTLNSPRTLNKAAGGLTINQLITDFGRTHNLVLSARSNARAQLENVIASEQDITLTVDQAFYRALTAQADLTVAQQTVRQRQATVDQVTALTKAKLRSEVDLTFAQVQLSQAQLLLLSAKNEEQDAMAALNTVLGSERNQPYTLVDQTSSTPPPPPADPEPLVQEAFTARPDLAALNDNFTETSPALMTIVVHPGRFMQRLASASYQSSIAWNFSLKS